MSAARHQFDALTARRDLVLDCVRVEDLDREGFLACPPDGWLRFVRVSERTVGDEIDDALDAHDAVANKRPNF